MESGNSADATEDGDNVKGNYFSNEFICTIFYFAGINDFWLGIRGAILALGNRLLPLYGSTPTIDSNRKGMRLTLQPWPLYGGVELRD